MENLARWRDHHWTARDGALHWKDRICRRWVEEITLAEGRGMFFKTGPNLGPRCFEKSLRPALRARRIQMGSIKCLKSWNFRHHQDFTKSCRNRLKIFNFCSNRRSHR
jgi:hypothetical protein